MTLSRWQETYARALSRQPEFKQWCVDPDAMVDGIRVDGTPSRSKLISFYTKDGSLHLERLNDVDVLGHITLPPVNGG